MVFQQNDQSISDWKRLGEISGWCGALPQSAHRKERVQLQHCWPRGEFLGKSTGNQWFFLNNPAWSTMGNGPAKRWSENQSLEILEINHDRNLVVCFVRNLPRVAWFGRVTSKNSLMRDLVTGTFKSKDLTRLGLSETGLWMSPSKWPSPTWQTSNPPWWSSPLWVTQWLEPCHPQSSSRHLAPPHSPRHATPLRCQEKAWMSKVLKNENGDVCSRIGSTSLI